ncbi:MAG TPA: hypothetical protein PLK06_00655 [bacterium]|nr:hypothetical protein [bacterium]
MTLQRKSAILLLLPDARLRDIYMSRFERDGWEVDVAVNLVDAERRAVQLRPLILLVHYSMLENVKAALKRLHGLPTLLQTKIVVADRHLSRAAVSELLKEGADQVIMTTHLTPQALVQSMNSLIDASV